MSPTDRPYLDKSQPATYKAMVGVTKEVGKASKAAGIDRALSELINIRVSQINGCVACLSVHVPAARRAGVSPLKLDLLPAWRDAEVFTERERACLTVAEALTVPSAGSGTLSGPALDSALADAAQVLNDDELAAAQWTAIAINAFNRISIASGHPPYTANYGE
ncbi:carboxymuconolactone decarboxylase family protein [Corynebacterium sp. zg254]|uniref:Carboxymuconolactone decarboxylase family protein n=1 Tax=Corynebacterium zhongnanshanii TaxID=2768834 RepID=A0ABQ6VE11_9CORY|nr:MULTISPECIES: carboxymuconolactone decarboxylase family protein [Corynebacterium]KAB3522675.1 carboxymuconolactone decarboxylase family protein [Corynebacterium zhongnanshanii]MCR5914277.1 carboxymuconolactone decarboxylase family protein [Corynebacterium sp. zg254]